MAKKKVLVSVILIILIVVIGLIAKEIIKNEFIPLNKDFIYLGLRYSDGIIIDDSKVQESMDFDKYYVIKNYDDYKSIINSSILKLEDFSNNNYILIPISYDSCSQRKIEPTDYTIDGKSIKIIVKYSASCGCCASKEKIYLLKVDKSITDVEVNLEYKSVSKVQCSSIDKPIMYLYPSEETEVNIKLGNKDYLTTSYPKYKDGWNVVANPSGTLKEKTSGKEYYGLYWEGNNYPAKIKSDGFVIKGEDTATFLEEKLKMLGLNPREINEFIIYWLPQLEKNKYNYIRFANIEEINNYMPLHITPTPDTIIRIFMEYKPLDKKLYVRSQTLTTPKREGFTVVEWGGSLIN